MMRRLLSILLIITLVCMTNSAFAQSTDDAEMLFFDAELSANADATYSFTSDGQLVTATPSQNIFGQNFDDVQAAIDYAVAKYPGSDNTTWNHTRTLGQKLGFAGGFSSGNATYTKGEGIDGKGALAVSGITDTQSYLEYNFPSAYSNGILCLSFDINMDNTKGLYPSLRFVGGTSIDYTLNSRNTVYGSWQNVKIYYDLYTDKMYYGDNTADFTPAGGVKTLRFNMMPGKGNTILLDNFCIDFYPVQPPFMVSPANGEYVYGPDVNIEAIVYGATELKAAYINGTRIRAEFDTETQKVTYTGGGFDYGVKELKIIVQYSDGSVRAFDSRFTLVKPIGKKFEGGYISAATYDNLTESSTIADKINNYNSTVSRISGPTGRTNDFAPLFTHNGGGEATAYISGTGFSKDNWNSFGGYFVMEFDYYMNHSGKYEGWLASVGLWGGSAQTFITSAGKVYGTQATLSNGNWYHFRMVLDREENKWYVWLDGSLIVDGLARTEMSFNGSIYFRLRAATNKDATSFGLDNIRIYNTTFEPTVISEIPSTIAPDTTDLSFKFNKSVSFAEDDIIFYVNGNPNRLSDVAISDKTVTVTLPKLKAGSKLKFVFADGKANNSVCVNVANKDGTYIESDFVSFLDTAASAVVFGDNLSAEKSVKAVIAFYSSNGKKLVGAEIEDVVISHDSSAAVVFSASDTDTDKAKIIIFDSSESLRPLALCDSVGEFDDILDEYISIHDTEEDAKALLETDVVFMANGDSYYEHGKKQSYSERGLSVYTDENGTVMVPSQLVAQAFDSEIMATSAEVFADNVSYLPVASYAGDVMGKYVYEDERGFVLISDKIRNYANSENIKQNLEDIDIIYRYMQFERPSGEQLYSDFVKTSGEERPRLFVKKSDIPALKQKINNNTNVKAVFDELIGKCDVHLQSEPTKYEIPDGLRLFKACDKVKHILMDLGVAYIITDDTKYADRMWVELENCLNWKDWNVKNHFLDSGEIVPGIAFAYDVLADYLTDSQKSFIRQKTTEHYVDYVVGVFTGESIYTALSSRQTGTNWGAVNSTAMLLCALSFMGEESANSSLMKKCRFIAENALQSLEYPIGSMFPDGNVDEGLGYWEYYVEHISWSINALRNMCGSDYSLLSAPGFDKATDTAMYLQTANGAFNYGGMGTTGSISPPELFLISKFYNNPTLMQLAEVNRKNINAPSDAACWLLWYEPGNEDVDISSYPLDKYFDGQKIIAIRSGWNADSSYVGIIGGYNNEGSQFDKGSFIYEQNGVRWFEDMGKGNQNVDGGYYGKDGWTLYVKRTEGHNSLVINPTAPDPGQLPYGKADNIRMESKQNASISVIDLSEVYADKVKYYKRGFLLGECRQTLTVQDELELINPDSELYYSFHTYGKVSINPDGKSAIITRNGKQLKAEFICDASDWRLSTSKADSLFPENVRENEYSRAGVNKLVFRGTASGKLSISVKFSPVDNCIYENHRLVPIDEWIIQ